MIFEKENMIDLNEENISNVFKYCIATRDISPDDLISTSFFEKEAQIPVPEMKFSRQRLHEKSNVISYMFCQLEKIHKNDLEILLEDGFKKYDGSVWTTNKTMVFSLYYLACATGFLPKFKPVPRLKAFASDLLLNYFIEPTLSPNDSNFDEWSKVQLAKTKKLNDPSKDKNK